MLADEALNLLEFHAKTQNLSGNESHSERHKQNSNPDLAIVLEPSFPESRVVEVESDPGSVRKPERPFPLGMVLDACPDIIDYARGGISNWRDFLATAAMVRSMLGISPSAWLDAQNAMGETEASIVVAAILQRGEAISSAGGYLRGLTRKAEANEFSIGPMLMALIGSRRREPKRA